MYKYLCSKPILMASAFNIGTLGPKQCTIFHKSSTERSSSILSSSFISAHFHTSHLSFIYDKFLWEVSRFLITFPAYLLLHSLRFNPAALRTKPEVTVKSNYTV